MFWDVIFSTSIRNFIKIFGAFDAVCEKFRFRKLENNIFTDIIKQTPNLGYNPSRTLRRLLRYFSEE